MGNTPTCPDGRPKRCYLWHCYPCTNSRRDIYDFANRLRPKDLLAYQSLCIVMFLISLFVALIFMSGARTVRQNLNERRALARQEEGGDMWEGKQGPI
jgi:hypothetical protein